MLKKGILCRVGVLFLCSYVPIIISMREVRAFNNIAMCELYTLQVYIAISTFHPMCGLAW